jgi:hypothetical protein
MIPLRAIIVHGRMAMQEAHRTAGPNEEGVAPFEIAVSVRRALAVLI